MGSVAPRKQFVPPYCGMGRTLYGKIQDDGNLDHLVLTRKRTSRPPWGNRRALYAVITRIRAVWRSVHSSNCETACFKDFPTATATWNGKFVVAKA